MTRRRKAAIIILVLLAIATLAINHKTTKQCLADGKDQAVCYGVKG